MERRRLEDLVRHYRQKPVCHHTGFYRAARDISEAVRRAALAHTPNGKHRHQARIRRRTLELFLEALARHENRLDQAASFTGIHDIVEESRVHGIGPLTVYDAALRIGAFRGLAPQEVYLHAGALDGAKKLGLVPGSSGLCKINCETLPPSLQALEPWQVEDFLCRYKKSFVRRHRDEVLEYRSSRHESVGVVDDPDIRTATDADLARVHAWLQEEDHQEIHGNFLCNWNVVVSHHTKHKLVVYTDCDGLKPIGFIAGGLTRDGILQVRHPHRGRGVGRALVEHVLRASTAEGNGILVIQCAPETSIPFWKKMGFTIFNGSYAYRLLPIRHEPPPEGQLVEVAIHFFSEERKRRGDVAPISSHLPSAVETSDGRIHLRERVQFPECLLPGYEDPVVEIVVKGERLYLDKAKYPEAEKFGVERCDEGFQIDRINIRD